MKMILSFPWADSWMVTSVKVLEMLQVITAGLPLGTDTIPSVQIGLSQLLFCAFRETTRSRVLNSLRVGIVGTKGQLSMASRWDSRP